MPTDLERFYKTHRKVLEFQNNIRSLAEMAPDVKSGLETEISEEIKAHEERIKDLNEELTRIKDSEAFAQSLLNIYGTGTNLHKE